MENKYCSSRIAKKMVFINLFRKIPEYKTVCKAADLSFDLVKLIAPDLIDKNYTYNIQVDKLVAPINVSDKVVKIIQSYVGVVNKMVWRKDI